MPPVRFVQINRAPIKIDENIVRMIYLSTAPPFYAQTTKGYHTPHANR